MGYRVEHVTPSGRYFFHAILYQLQHSELKNLFSGYTVEKLVMETVQYLLKNQAEFDELMAGDINDFISNLIKQEKISEAACIKAASLALKIRIVVINSDNSQPIIRESLLPETTIYLGYQKGLYYRALTFDPNLTPTQSLEKYIQKFNSSNIESEETVFPRSRTFPDLTQQCFSLWTLSPSSSFGRAKNDGKMELLSHEKGRKGSPNLNHQGSVVIA